MPRRLLALLVCLAGPPVVAAPSADAPVVRVAFGSCADQDKPCPAWESVVATQPDTLVLLGDTIYADLDKSVAVTPTVIREKYAILDALPAFQKLRQTARLLGTWDDHDYGKNDAGSEWKLKDEAQAALLDFYRVPADSPRRFRKGVYHAETFGPAGQRVQFILLDGRYHRSEIKRGTFDPVRRLTPSLPNTEPGATQLGEEQWTWLAEQLRQPAELRLIGSGIQVLSEEHPFEKWSLIPKERDRLFQLLRETQANGVVILSGDRHLGELSVSTSAISYPLYDVTASGFNQANPAWRAPEENKHRVAAVPFGHHFGLVEIDWKDKPTVSLQLRDEAGKVLVNHTVPVGLLTPQDGKKDEKEKPRPEGVLSPAEAMKKVGEMVTVQFEVKSARLLGEGKRFFLNSEANNRDEKNFTIVLNAKARGDKWKDAKEATFKGKTVRVKGKVTEFMKKPQIEVDDETAIEIVE